MVSKVDENVNLMLKMKFFRVFLKKIDKQLNSLDRVFDTCVQVEHMIANEPNEVGKIAGGRFLFDKLLHRQNRNPKYVQSQRAHGYSYHGFNNIE